VQKKVMLIIGAGLLALLAALGLNTPQPSETAKASNLQGDSYERAYSPSIGPDNAAVTIVEFFDPACEACRAIHPYVKEILNRHPNEVRLVLRYAAFHKSSDTAIGMLEAARLQELFLPVLEALLKDQNQWASHGSPDIDRAWELAQSAGLDIQQAKEIIESEKFDELLNQENADILALKVNKTPTFFVNKKPLESFGPDQLYALVLSEIQRGK